MTQLVRRTFSRGRSQLPLTIFGLTQCDTLPLPEYDWCSCSTPPSSPYHRRPHRKQWHKVAATSSGLLSEQRCVLSCRWTAHGKNTDKGDSWHRGLVCSLLNQTLVFPQNGYSSMKTQSTQDSKCTQHCQVYASVSFRVWVTPADESLTYILAVSV